ncbi:MAG: hypothetical protein Q7R60_03005 [bacterium]|nr:hypothetical protein [bacterium]
MQPQATIPQSPPPPAPPVESSSQNSTGPAGQFDFMMKDQPKPPNRLSGLFGSLPRPAKIILGGVAGLLLLIVLYSLFFGGKTTNADQIFSVAARAQEIARVSTLAQTGSQNTDTKGLAATTSEVLASQEQQLKSYLKSSRIKVDTKKLAAKLDKTSDTALATAKQNNNYDQTYFSYLKTNLVSYQSDITSANKSVGKKAQAILSAAYASVQTLLSAPQLK